MRKYNVCDNMWQYDTPSVMGGVGPTGNKNASRQWWCWWWYCNISSVTYLKSNIQLSNWYFFIRSIILETCIEKSLNKKNQSVCQLIAFWLRIFRSHCNSLMFRIFRTIIFDMLDISEPRVGKVCRVAFWPSRQLPRLPYWTLFALLNTFIFALQLNANLLQQRQLICWSFWS